MSSRDISVSVRGLSKSYTIVSNVEKHITMAETVLERVKNPFKRVEKETFWALKEIEFDIRRGEVVGIIGRNGAGKSTLLKILSEITEPTTGEVSLYGRVGSLLEVGTGFHPELTGRENIFLNGAILGMSRREIERQFDQIVEFAEVETFLDTPVKRYSSGMYVRLAFAVAAHLNPEILIVDEVLAVGDAGFQKKCLGKMEDVAKTGRTVLFVSHNMEAVRRLCSRAIMIEGGAISQDGTTDDTLRTYFDLIRKPNELTSVGLHNRLNRHSCDVQFSHISSRNASGEETWSFNVGDTIHFTASYKCFKSIPSLGVYLALTSCRSGEMITSLKRPVTDRPICAGDSGTVVLELPDIMLRPGEFSIYIGLGDLNCNTLYDVIDENVNIPLLSISSDETDVHHTEGYVSTAARVLVDRGQEI